MIRSNILPVCFSSVISHVPFSLRKFNRYRLSRSCLFPRPQGNRKYDVRRTVLAFSFICADASTPSVLAGRAKLPIQEVPLPNLHHSVAFSVAASLQGLFSESRKNTLSIRFPVKRSIWQGIVTVPPSPTTLQVFSVISFPTSS